MLEMLSEAIGWATLAHSGQVDKAGKPYIEHPLAVMRLVQEEIDKIVAVLHDVVEDSDITISNIRHGFGVEVADAVDALTRRPGERPEDYYQRVRRNQIAVRVKKMDIQHNSAPERLAVLPEPLRNRLSAKYAKALNLLEAA